jgi:non-ribosomal peptide synthetase component F
MDKTFLQFLDEVKTNALKAYENQDYQFEELVSKLGIDPDPSRQNLFNTMLEHLDIQTPEIENKYNYENLNIDKKDTGTNKNQNREELTFSPYEFKNPIIQFDLLLHVINFPGKIGFKLLYSTKLFKKETIENFIRHLINTTREAISNPNSKISEIEMLSSKQEEALLESEQEKLNNLEIDFDL